MELKVVETSVLSVWKSRIPIALGLADHYYLATSISSPNTLGWGPKGLELKGSVQVTAVELERIERFIRAERYLISTHNCEHFANYVLHGINHSTQMYTHFKRLGAEVVALLQPTHGKAENYSEAVSQQAASCLNRGLIQARIERAIQDRRNFWASRGVSLP